MPAVLACSLPPRVDRSAYLAAPTAACSKLRLSAPLLLCPPAAWLSAIRSRCARGSRRRLDRCRAASRPAAAPRARRRASRQSRGPRGASWRQVSGQSCRPGPWLQRCGSQPAGMEGRKEPAARVLLAAVGGMSQRTRCTVTAHVHPLPLRHPLTPRPASPDTLVCLPARREEAAEEGADGGQARSARRVAGL